MLGDSMKVGSSQEVGAHWHESSDDSVVDWQAGDLSEDGMEQQQVEQPHAGPVEQVAAVWQLVLEL